MVDLLPENWLWPASRLDQALSLLTGGSASTGTPAPDRKPPTGQDGIDHVAKWIESASLDLGFEAQPAETTYADLELQLRHMGPALLHIPTAAGPAFLAFLASGKLLTANRKKVQADPAAIRSVLCAAIEAPLFKEIGDALHRAQIPESKQARARDAMLRERLSDHRIHGIWLLRLPPGASYFQQLWRARIPRRLAALSAAHALQYLLWILAWYVAGSNVLRGSSNRAWLMPWSLLLLSTVPLRVLITRLQGWVAIGAGALLKQRLFVGSLRLDPDSLRHQGAGQLLGRVLESEAVEALALSGGFLALVAVIELAVATVILGIGAGSLPHASLLLFWLLVVGIIARNYWYRNRDWTDVRLALTHELVESMTGHRTRLAQLHPDRWHDGEDTALESYLQSSRAMDRSTIGLIALAPRGWLVVGILSLAPAVFIYNASPAPIAIAIGGVLLAYRALRRLAAGAQQLASAAVAWQRTSILFQAATREELPGAINRPSEEPSPLVVDASDVAFTYRDRPVAVLESANLEIAAGDRVVLQGPSGGGKSTLISLLIGVRQPTSGRILIHGLDRATMGATEWRRRLAAAPQFHENHVLAETFAFNLFLGHPAVLTPADLEKAATICRELGLGDLLDRMPAGMLQMVGETGWQLSHGERSRLYIARALLQDAELVVLDESFAALDPENLQRAVECVVKRAPALLVVAHR